MIHSISRLLVNSFDLSYLRNLGPTGAKQIGAEHAVGNWLIFMDSDDVFVTDRCSCACEVLESVADNCPIVFFRCINKSDGKLIGTFFEKSDFS